MPAVEKIAEGFTVAEGPHWDIKTQNLYFVDVFANSIIQYSPSTKKITKSKLDSLVTFIIPIEDKTNQYITSTGNQLALIQWDGTDNSAEIISKFCPVMISSDPPTTYNDAKCDSSGRLWIGAHVLAPDIFKTQPHGILYSIDSNKKMQSHIDQIRCANGIAFNHKTQKMFFIDSLLHSIDCFDFDLTARTISNRQVWFSLKKFRIDGIPDGLTIDSDGNLWVAVFGGFCVLKIDGTQPQVLLETIKLPAEQVTSCVFGGANLDELFVTTGGIEIGGKICDPLVDGAVYKITGLGVTGLPSINYKIKN